ncbi:hypothetical protein D3C75_1110860 [compost metagenome]
MPMSHMPGAGHNGEVALPAASEAFAEDVNSRIGVSSGGAKSQRASGPVSIPLPQNILQGNAFAPQPLEGFSCR